jgi:hypothetical protein
MNSNTLPSTLRSACALLLISGALQAQTSAQVTDWAESQRILPAELAFLQGTGRAIAVDGGRMVLGDPADDEGNLAGVGSVSWFERVGETYVLRERLRGAQLAAGDFYGSAVDLQSLVLAVGAPHADLGAVQDAGLVELWSVAVSPATRLITLSAPQLAGAEFGASLSLDLPRMAVGAPGEDGGRGAVYYFGQVGGGWALLERLQPAELQPGDRFGSTVSAQGNRVVVGAPQRAQGSLVNAGAVYIYDQSLLGLQLGARFDGSVADARLGESISQDAVSVVAGAPGANEVRLWEGGVGTYSVSATLTGSVPGAAFGSAVALNNGLLAIGSPEDSSIVFRSGSVQLYARAAGAWSPLATLRAGGFQTLYGSAIALGDELVLGGAPGMFGGGFFSVGGGVVHEPRLQRLCSGSQVPCPCNSGSHGCVNSTGQGARLDGSGATSLVVDGLTLQASGLPNGFCALFQGTERSMPTAFGDGVLCVGGTLVRLGSVRAQAGVASWPPAGTTPLAQLGAVAAPGVRLYQAWYRDGVPGFCTVASFNTTDSVRAVWRP